MSFLLDTNVLSEIRKGKKADTAVMAWARGQPETRQFISAISIFEIEQGIHMLARKDATRAMVFRDWLDNRLLVSFAGRILPVDEQVARVIAPFHVPNRRPLADSLIAGTAIVNDLTIVTRNLQHFDYPGLQVINPWDHAA